MNDYELLETLVKGSLVLVGVVLVGSAVVFVGLVLAPFAVGLAIYSFASWVWGLYDYNFGGGREREEARMQAALEFRRRFFEQIEEEKRRKLEADFEQWKLQRQRVADDAKQRELKIQRQRELQSKKYLEEKAEEKRLALERRKKLFNSSFETLGDDVFLESNLPVQKREELLGKRYKRLKVSPFGVSGAGFYLVYARHNESKEHAFFCYLIKALLETFVEEEKVWLYTTKGPDVVCKYGDERYCFDVETGSNWARRREWVKRKFTYYGKEYDKSFIFVTSKKLKFKYSKLGIVVTRGTLRKTIVELFKNKKVTR